MGQNRYIILFILLAYTLLFSLNIFSSADPWWDSSVYMGMGKHIFSLGNSGLWEGSRPLVWPTILGFFWRIGLDPIFFGRLTNILFGLGSIILTYLIAKKLFNEKTAVVSATLLAFSPTFFKFTGILYTEISALFFVLLAFYLFLEKRYAISGLFFGIASMTRFFFGFVILPIFIFLLIELMKKRAKTNNIIRLLIFFMLPIIPYLIFNQIIYNNFLYPFTLQAYMTQSSNWYWVQPFSFYFIGLFKENFLILFLIPGIILLMKEKKKTIIPLTLFFTFIPFLLAAHKEMRFMLLSLPFVYIISAYALLKIIKNKKLLIGVALLFAIITVPNLRFNEYNDNLDPFYQYIQNNNIKEPIWISNPSFILHTNNKADILYYPLFTKEKINEINQEISDANHILINTCDLGCVIRDPACEDGKAELINELKNRFNTAHYSKNQECEYYIFEN